MTRLFAILLCLCLAPSLAEAQWQYRMQRDGSNAVETALGAIVTTATGCNDVGKVVLGDGTCGAAPGTPTGANPTATAGPTAVNGSASTFMRSDGAPAVQTATTGQKGLVQPDGTTISIASGVISAIASQRLAIGWDPGIDPTLNIIATVDQASTVVSIVGTVATAVGASATVQVYKAGSGTACGSGTALTSDTLNANGTAATNQTLTVTTSSISAGDRLCLVTTGGSNWTSGAGVGGVTVRMTTP